MAKLASRREESRGRRHLPDQRRHLQRAVDIARVAGGHLRRASHAAVGARNPPEQRPQGVERQEKLAAATPSIWPAKGWLTAGSADAPTHSPASPQFHQGLDISASKGQPVYATADGRVELGVVRWRVRQPHRAEPRLRLTTRYGHLSGFNVKHGETVHRGDVIGYVGSTGRSTGAHLHYEILVNGKLLNPMQLLTQPTAARRTVAKQGQQGRR